MITLTSYFKEVQKELERSDRESRTKAAKHVLKVLRRKAKARYGKGNYYKGLRYKHENDITKIGAGPPAYHAHLIEFGTDPRFKESGKPTGKMPANPLIIPTLDEETETVGNILVTEWS